MSRRSFLQTLALASLMLAFLASGQAQTAGPRALITQSIDEHRLVTLAGNTRPEAKRQSDLGPVADDLHLDMYLQLKRSPEQDLAAQRFVESLTDKTSPNFHKWITAAEYGQRFGAAPDDVATVSRWLESHGFTVNAVPANRMVIDFSGNAGQVRAALHTEIHSLNVAGKRYFANISDPQIPAALLPAVTGVVSLNNIMPQPALEPRAQYSVSASEFPLVPGDLAAIYNLAPVFAGGYTGQGQTIVVVEDTDLYKGTGDWNTFRSTFGLSQYSQGSLVQSHPAPPSGGSTCEDPGVNGNDAEAAIDVEWASAAAPSAAIVMASCADTTNFGGFIALQNMLTNGGPLPSVVSISYGGPEVVEGPSFNYYINILYQTAAAAGVSVFVSSGDAAAAAADRGATAAIMGISVSGFASTAYNVAVGGTDFGDGAVGDSLAFWSTINGANYSSATSYVPEIPWNDSCGSAVAASYLGFGANYGTTAFCNAYPFYANTIGGSGGPSGCATGTQDIVYAVSGTCAGYAKPSWQSIFGNPNDGVRDIPDVSLFASNGNWGHYYVVCLSDGGSCKGLPSTWPGYGGTSVSSPIMAGIQALINQASGQTNVGNPNPVYYQIAQAEYSTSAGRAACNSTNGPASSCSFNDVTDGDIVLPCAGQIDCYTVGDGIGLMSTSTKSFEPAYAAAPGWDFATGIGSVNAFNLLNAFVNSVAPTGGPTAPQLVSPANGATGVLPTALLTWNASSGATSYDVYFGTASTPPLVTNTAEINYAPGTLASGTAYYWAVGARNSLGANASSAWSFSTGCLAALNPSSATAPAVGGANSIPVTAGSGCSWTAVSDVAWITISSGSSGGGNGTVAYTVAANTGAQRYGTITVASQTFTVTQAGIYPLISTLAGGIMPPTTAPGTSVSIALSYGIAVDSSGNTYFPSPFLESVFKMDSTGAVTRVAGTGAWGKSGDGGPALNATLNDPQAVAVDAAGNLYIADTGNYRILKVDASGTITPVAGGGGGLDGLFGGYGGDGGPATSAEIGSCSGLAVDASGNLYISDGNNNVVRKVSPAGIITTVAGNGTPGYSGDGGPATSARLQTPFGLAVDTAGNLYIADTYNQRIRMVSTSGTITTVAGNGTHGYSGDGAAATKAQINYASGVTVDAAGNLYIADYSNDAIRKVSTTGTITTVAGVGTLGYSGDGGAATSAHLDAPAGVAVDASGNVYVTDLGNSRIRQVSAAGTIATFVGGANGDGGLGVLGYFNVPWGVARDNAGNTYVADAFNHRIRKVATNGTITTVAGSAISGYFGDGGPATSAQLNQPYGVAVDASGNLYIADTRNFRIRKVDSSGNITTVAGTGTYGYSGDGAAALKAQIAYVSGVAVDAAGNLYIVDGNYSVVRKIAVSGIITTVAGTGKSGYSGDGGPATSAQLSNPYSVTVDGSGNLFIADTSNNRVRMVSTSGVITTVAGNGSIGNSGDGGPATSAQLLNPFGVGVDAAGNLYISANCGCVRMVSAAGNITTVAGSGGVGYTGDGGVATFASFQNTFTLAVDSAGNVAVVDQVANAVRLLTPSYSVPVLTIQSAHSGTFAQGQNGASYTLTVSNGAGAAPTSGTVTVTEIPPAGLTVASMAGTGWTCTAPTCTRSDALTGGSSYPAITVAVNVAAAAPAQLTNQASVSGGGANTAARATDLTLIGPPNAQTAPSIAPGGIVPIDSTVGTIQPGEWVSIFGTNLATSTVTWNSNFPTSLGGTSVTIDGKNAYLSFVSAGQINLQAPDDAATGSVPVVVTTASGSVTSSVTLAKFGPAFLLLDGKHVAGIIPRSDGTGAYGGGSYDIVGPTGTSLGYPTVAAKAGDIVELFGTGFGPTNPAVPAGKTFSGAASTTSPVSILINSVSIIPIFAGLSAAGLDQVNLAIPAGLGTGDVPLLAAVGGVQTPSYVVISLK